MFSAHVVKKKGNENEEASRVIKDIEKMDCKGKIIVKTDQEPSILSVAKEIRRLRSEDTVLESSKVYDSQSNGIAESSPVSGVASSDLVASTPEEAQREGPCHAQDRHVAC